MKHVVFISIRCICKYTRTGCIVSINDEVNDSYVINVALIAPSYDVNALISNALILASGHKNQCITNKQERPD